MLYTEHNSMLGASSVKPQVSSLVGTYVHVLTYVHRYVHNYMDMHAHHPCILCTLTFDKQAVWSRFGVGCQSVQSRFGNGQFVALFMIATVPVHSNQLEAWDNFLIFGDAGRKLLLIAQERLSLLSSREMVFQFLASPCPRVSVPDGYQWLYSDHCLICSIQESLSFLFQCTTGTAK